MHNIWLIARREYLERVRAKSFLVMTVLVPLIMSGILFGAAVINSHGKSASHIAVVSQDAHFALDLQSELQNRKQGRITVDPIAPPRPETRAYLDSELTSKDLDGYLWVTPPAHPGARATFEWVPKSEADIFTRETIAEAVRSVLTREGLAHSGMGVQDVDALMQPVDLNSSRARKNDSAAAAVISAYGLFFLMYFVILYYGMNVARSIIEEKTSRVFEVLLATIRPYEMMAGKVLGVGAVGLTQVAIWMVTALVLAAASAPTAGFSLHFNVVQIVFFVIFFILGYVLYSGMAAALGAMTSSEQELQQMNMVLMLPLIACSVIIFRVITDSDGTLAKIFSFIPFCTPLIMYVRIAVHTPPWYQIALSLVLLLATIYVILWIAARIYRVGILMYGKKPNLPEILRWLKYS